MVPIMFVRPTKYLSLVSRRLQENDSYVLNYIFSFTLQVAPFLFPSENRSKSRILYTDMNLSMSHLEQQ